MKKIAVITATRAEYGLLYPLIKKMLKDDFFECHVIVTGSHLLYKYGYTIDDIKKDNVPIYRCISIMNEDNNDTCEVIACAIKEFDKLYKSEMYDAIILLGDRYELFGFAIPALFNKIPIIHIHGGEKTEGALDEQIRHSITKLSSIHFASMDEYKKRIIQLGENPDYVFNVGALGIDNICNMSFLDKEALEREIGIDLKQKVAVVTYHPVTLDEKYDNKEQIKNLLEALLGNDLFLVITMPNTDKGNTEIIEIIKEYESKYSSRIKTFKSLGQLRYLSLLKYAELVVGNSSSGIIETASFKIPTVNVGDRQKGRLMPDNVICCSNDIEDIDKAIKKAMSEEFKSGLSFCVNPYGDGHAADRITDILKKIDWDREGLLVKRFNDI